MDARTQKQVEKAKKTIVNNSGSLSGSTIRYNNPGLKVLAAIDCLVNYAGYTWNKKG